MQILVIGAAASGKSGYAENLLQKLPAPRRYLATMEPFGEEAHLRIEKHRAARTAKGFETLECCRDLERLEVSGGSLLLECLTNLAANELYSPAGAEGCEERILRGVERLSAQVENLIVVTGDVFADGMGYSAETLDYCRLLANLNRKLAAEFDAMAEIVCGLPLIYKNKEGLL